MFGYELVNAHMRLFLPIFRKMAAAHSTYNIHLVIRSSRENALQHLGRTDQFRSQQHNTPRLSAHPCWTFS